VKGERIILGVINKRITMKGIVTVVCINEVR